MPANKVVQGQTKGVAGDTALSAITTAGAMIHGRIHLGMSLAGYKSTPLQDICTSQNPSRLFSLRVC